MRTLSGLGGAACSPARATAPTPPSALPDASRHVPRAAQRRPDAARDLGGNGGALEQRVGEQLRAGGQRARDPVVIGRGHRHRVRRGVEQDGDDVDPRDAVDERVMGLGQQGEAVVGEPLDQPHLPQRARAVQRLGEDPAGQALELGLAAGAGQRGVADVEADVEVRIVHPHRPALIEGHEGQPLAVARDEVQPAGDLLDQLVVGRRLALEDHAAGDVHVRGVALEVQEGAVEPGQAVGIGHGLILARAWV